VEKAIEGFNGWRQGMRWDNILKKQASLMRRIRGQVSTFNRGVGLAILGYQIIEKDIL